MNNSTRLVIESVFETSNKGTIHFGEVIQQLMSVQVEAYFVDYRSGRSTYFLPNDETLDLSFEKPNQKITEDFQGDSIRSFILDAQKGKVMYPEFKQLSQTAGCIGYMVWITGQHVTYYGRKGETHVERFPD